MPLLMEIYSKGIVSRDAQDLCGEHQERCKSFWTLQQFRAVVECLSLKGSKSCVDVVPGDMSIPRGIVGISDLRGLFQP